MEGTYVELIGTLLTVGIGGSIFAWWITEAVKKRLTDLEKVPNLEMRVVQLEMMNGQHNDTKDAMIRLEEKVAYLADQVKLLTDLLMRKIVPHG